MEKLEVEGKVILQISDNLIYAMMEFKNGYRYFAVNSEAVKLDLPIINGAVIPEEFKQYLLKHDVSNYEVYLQKNLDVDHMEIYKEVMRQLR